MMTCRHLDHLVQRLPALEACATDVEKVFHALRSSFRAGGKLLLCGNGGSASDAEHWAGELLKGFCRKRPLTSQEKSNLPVELAGQLQGALPVIPLTGFPALASAFGNDVAGDLTLAQLVWGLGKTGDVLVGISTSGHARNVCAAAETARAKGMFTVALTGKSGGKLSALCDLSIRVPAEETYLVQECHLPIYHCLSLMLEDEFFGERR